MPMPSALPLSRRTVVLFVVAATALLLLGTYVGLRAPWGTKHPRVLHGVAMRANDENDLVMFDADDGTQLTLYANALWWETESQGGEGDPPCLQTPLQKARVDVGVVRVAGPYGGWHQQAVWLTCL